MASSAEPRIFYAVRWRQRVAALVLAFMALMFLLMPTLSDGRLERPDWLGTILALLFVYPAYRFACGRTVVAVLKQDGVSFVGRLGPSRGAMIALLYTDTLSFIDYDEIASVDLDSRFWTGRRVVFHLKDAGQGPRIATILLPMRADDQVQLVAAIRNKLDVRGGRRPFPAEATR